MRHYSNTLRAHLHCMLLSAVCSVHNPVARPSMGVHSTVDHEAWLRRVKTHLKSMGMYSSTSLYGSLLVQAVLPCLHCYFISIMSHYLPTAGAEKILAGGRQSRKVLSAPCCWSLPTHQGERLAARKALVGGGGRERLSFAMSSHTSLSLPQWKTPAVWSC